MQREQFNALMRTVVWVGIYAAGWVTFGSAYALGIAIGALLIAAVCG